MKKVLIILACCLTLGMQAQNVERKGNQFVEVKASAKPSKSDTKTAYTFKAKDGKEYPIYLSKNGKAYIIRVSKKTGNEYRQYLPQVTEQLSKSK